MKDVVIPIVFPEYKISVEVKPKSIDIIPWVTWDNFETPKLKQKFEDLGHAGVLFINGETGTTKYYEYGRYRSDVGVGVTQKLRNLPDVKIIGGNIDQNSFKKTLSYISSEAGKNGPIKAAFIEVDGKYEAMLEYAQFRVSQKTNADREPYNLFTNSCLHFMKSVVEKAGVETPTLVDPRPVSYIDEFREMYRDLDYELRGNKLSIESSE